MTLVMIVVMIESTGMFLALGDITGKRSRRRALTAGLRTDGLGTLIGGIFNTFPYTSFSQNVGLVGVTGVKSRWVCVAGGVIMIVLGLLPKMAALVESVPIVRAGRRRAGDVRHGGRHRHPHPVTVDFGRRCAAGLTLRRFSLRENSAAMLGGRSRRGTRYALRAPLRQPRRACHERALRAPTLPPALLATAEIAPPHTACREPRAHGTPPVARQHCFCKARGWAHRPGGASGTPSSARVSVGARSALRALTRRSCLSGARKARSEFFGATEP
jgi:hypothetical protein